MPKRRLYSSSESEAENLKKKTRRILFSDSSDESNHSDSHPPSDVEHNDDGAKSPPPERDGDRASPTPTVPRETAALDAELLAALGDTADDAPVYGPSIQPDLAQRWMPLLRKGMTKETKEALMKEYAPPENCKLLRGPTLNAEIAVAISESSKARDRKLETNQHQLGAGMTAIGRGLSLLLTGDDKAGKVRAIKQISDGARMLADLHFLETQARIKMITPGLDKTFSQMIQDVERDETLFSEKISQKIKASKIIEKQGLQIKKTQQANQKAPSTSASHSSRSRAQGNWSRAPRSQPTNRGGRGGAQKYPYNTRAHHSAPPPPPRAPNSEAKANAATNSGGKARAQARQ